MKNKFNILYENLLDVLQNSHVNYQIGDYSKIEQLFTNIKPNSIINEQLHLNDLLIDIKWRNNSKLEIKIFKNNQIIYHKGWPPEIKYLSIAKQNLLKFLFNKE